MLLSKSITTVRCFVTLPAILFIFLRGTSHSMYLNLKNWMQGFWLLISKQHLFSCIEFNYIRRLSLLQNQNRQPWIRIKFRHSFSSIYWINLVTGRNENLLTRYILSYFFFFKIFQIEHMIAWRTHTLNSIKIISLAKKYPFLSHIRL